ncbi:MAG: PDZ domain-containing protein, partial [Arenimonas sp.]|nr:PDZ domain-containing protein [Arenimonas sp.]
RINGQPVADHAALEAVAGQPPAGGKPLVVEFQRQAERRVALLAPIHGDKLRTPLPEIGKAWAGVEVQPVTATLARDLGLPASGFRITRVYPGSPLAAGGARVGDLLSAVEGVALRAANEDSDDGFHQRVRDLAIGAKVRFDGFRDGKARSFDVTLAESPANTSALRTLALTRLRAQTREMGFYDRAARRLPASQQGVVVDGVEAGGPAGLAHLQGGDVIVRLGEQEVRDLAGLQAALDAALAKGNGRVIPVQVLRGQETRILYLERYWLTETP